MLASKNMMSAQAGIRLMTELSCIGELELLIRNRAAEGGWDGAADLEVSFKGKLSRPPTSSGRPNRILFNQGNNYRPC